MPIEVNEITIDDNLIEYYMKKFQQDFSDKGLAEIKLLARNELIKRALLLSLAEKNEVKIYEKDVSNKLFEMMNGDNNIEKFREKFNNTVLGFDGFMKLMTDDLKIENYLKEHFSPNEYNIGEDEIYNFYTSNQEHYESHKKIKVSHILLKSSSEDESSDKQFKFDLLLEIKYKDGTFEEKAKQFSECASAKNGGDLGYLQKGTMPKDFENVAFSLELGEVSNVFETYLGFHIVKCTEKLEGIDAAHDEIENYLKNMKIHKDIEQYIKQELNEATIVEY